MADKKVEVTIPEPELPPVTEESKETEILAKQAESQAEDASKEAEKAETQATQATEAAKIATEQAEKAQKSTSYNEYALKGLMDSITLVVTRMEQVMGIVKEMAEDFKEINDELRTTIELQQEQIADLDGAATKVVTATAALVKLHQEMNNVTE